MVLPVMSDETEAKTTVIKIALVTPEGSTWTNTIYRMADEISRRTDSAVAFKIFAGGISGDESDVLRKMRVNLIHAAGFSGVGLGIILPRIRILEAPRLFKNYEEIDFIKEKLFNEFAEAFEQKGYVLLGFAEAGFVYFFSRTDISTPEALKRIRMWMWKGDNVAKTFLDTFGIKTYPLHVTDVNTGLETGMIDSFYAPALAAIFFQWYAKIRYVLDYPIVNSTGAFLMKKRTFDRLPEKSRTILRETAKRYCDELTRLSRKENSEAIAVLKEAGIEFLTPSPRQFAAFEKNAKKTREINQSRLYPEALLDKVRRLLKAHRMAN
jgi:TRAP-type C4-dicarboxylate transport system substrate-binding protein